MKIKSFSDLQLGDVIQVTRIYSNHILYYAVLTNATENATETRAYSITVIHYPDHPRWNNQSILVIDNDLGIYYDAEVIGSTK